MCFSHECMYSHTTYIINLIAFYAHLSMSYFHFTQEYFVEIHPLSDIFIISHF